MIGNKNLAKVWNLRKVRATFPPISTRSLMLCKRDNSVMKTLELTQATDLLEEYARRAQKEPIILTDGGKPVAALVSIGNADRETIALSTNRQFVELIQRSRERHEAEVGISSAEMRKRLKAKRTTRSK